MKQRERISYEKPELEDYRFWGIASGTPQAPSDPQPDPEPECDTDFGDL